MLRRSTLMLALLIFLCSALPAQVQQPPANAAINTLSAAESAAAGWTLLFDGKTLSGLNSVGDADWKVEDGALTATKGTGYLVSPKPYTNFELKVDFWTSKTVNSGVFLRCGEGTPGPMTCYEIQIAGAGTGTLVQVAPLPPDMPDPTEKWNTYEIRAEGNHLTVKLNGKTTADAQDQRLATGTIALQEGGRGDIGIIRFRNVKIRPL